MAEQPKKGRLTLYEDLLSQETREEMAAKDAAKIAEAAKKKKDASLMFKPSFLGKKASQPKAKPKPNFSAMHKASSSVSIGSATSATPLPNESSLDQEPPSSTAQPKLTQKRGFNDWLANDDEEDFYVDRPRQGRGGRKNKKKKAQEQQQTWSWGDTYDPTLPVPFQDYRRSDVEYDINDEWKRRLYEAHKRELRRQGRDMSVKRASSDEDGYRPRMGMGQQFAPPAGGLGYAPPYDSDTLRDAPNGSSDPFSGRSSPYPANGRDRGYDEEPRPRPSFAPPTSFVSVNVEESADDAYARRMAMSGTSGTPVQTVTPPIAVAPTPKPPTASDDQKARIAAQIAAMKAKLGRPASSTPPAPPSNVPAEPPTDSPWTRQFAQAVNEPPPPPPPPDAATPPAVISGAPTYNPEYLAQKARAEAEAAADNMETDTHPPGAPEAPVERSSRPGQSGFAERLMKKLGWEKGQGLGASGEGITTAIYAKAEKRKKKGDAQGGGFATPANMGKIMGGKKAKPKGSTTTDATSTENAPPPSQMEDDPHRPSEVVKLAGMLENLDVDHEIAENNLMQEIGDEMGEQYGPVERLYVWRKHAGGEDDVFVKFTSQVSATKCVRGMDGTEFADNVVQARFWGVERFENGDYA